MLETKSLNVISTVMQYKVMLNQFYFTFSPHQPAAAEIPPTFFVHYQKETKCNLYVHSFTRIVFVDKTTDKFLLVCRRTCTVRS